MKIGGFQRFSLIDYPGCASAVVFTAGCNFRCPYCHNPGLVLPGSGPQSINESEVISFLEKRVNRLEAVVVTGGEPTIQHDLDRFLGDVKDLGYFVKLDTNGSRPAVLERVLRNKLADYIAMDVKGYWNDYGTVSGSAVNLEDIERSIRLVRMSGINFQFRTTCLPGFTNKDKIWSMTAYSENHIFSDCIMNIPVLDWKNLNEILEQRVAPMNNESMISR